MKTMLTLARLMLLALSTSVGLVAAQASVHPMNSDPSVAALRFDTVKVKVSTDKRIYAEGETVTMILEAKNEGDTAARLDFTSGQRFDFTVFDANGNALWNWAVNKSFIFLTGTEILQPGESISYQTDEFAAPGSGLYVLQGRITSTDPREARTVFGVEVEPLSINGIWAGESQENPGIMMPWQSWTGIVWGDLFHGEWSDNHSNQGMFKARRVAAQDPFANVFEGQWIGYGYGVTTGVFTIEFLVSEGKCFGHVISPRHPSLNRSIQGGKQSGDAGPWGRPRE